MSMLIDLVNQVECYNSIVSAAYTVTTQGTAIDMKNCHVSLGAVITPGARSAQTTTFAVQIEECATTNGTFTLIPGMVTAITTSGVDGAAAIVLRGLRTHRYVRATAVTVVGTTPSLVFGTTIISQKKISGSGAGATSGADRSPST